MILMTAVKQIDPNFAILKEARRECAEDVMDIANAKRILEGIEKGQINIVEIETKVPSPFALNLAIQGHADVLRMEEKYEFLRRMHNQILAKIDGKDVESLSVSPFISQSKDARHEFKEILKREAWGLKDAPKFVKAELIRIIDGARNDIDPKFIAGINERRKIIEDDWPVELKTFLFTVWDDLKTGVFSYEQLWSEEEVKKEQDNDEQKNVLFEEFNHAAKREKLDAQIRYDVYALIMEGAKGVRPETLAWLKQLFSGSISSVWKDNIAKFLLEK